MKKLTDEPVVQPWLPLLDEGKFQAPKVSATGEEGNWGPYDFFVPASSAGPVPLEQGDHE